MLGDISIMSLMSRGECGVGGGCVNLLTMVIGITHKLVWFKDSDSRSIALKYVLGTSLSGIIDDVRYA